MQRAQGHLGLRLRVERSGAARPEAGLHEEPQEREARAERLRPEALEPPQIASEKIGKQNN